MYGYPYEELITLSGKDIVHPDYYHLLKRLLEPEGYTVDSAYGGEEALRKLTGMRNACVKVFLEVYEMLY
jgi:DNA-binding response OmpR family regulator